MTYYGRGKSIQTGFLSVDHPFSQIHQNTGIYVIEKSSDGLTALVGSIIYIFSKDHESTTEVFWKDIKF